MNFMSHKHQLTDNVKLLQKAAIIRQQDSLEVLLLKRSADAKSRPNCWDLPGGNSEWPEADQSSVANLHVDDLKREILEETNLSVSGETLTLDSLTHFSTYFDSDKQVFTIICGWLIKHLSTDQNIIKISDEHQEYVWVKEADLNDYDFGGVKGVFILDIIKKAFVKY